MEPSTPASSDFRGQVISANMINSGMKKNCKRVVFPSGYVAAAG